MLNSSLIYRFNMVSSERFVATPLLVDSQSQNNAFLFKINFSSKSTDWVSQIYWDNLYWCVIRGSITQISADASTIYMFYTAYWTDRTGYSFNPILFASISISTGSSILTKCFPNIQGADFKGLVLNGDYLLRLNSIYKIFIV